MNTANRMERIFSLLVASALTLYAFSLLSVTIERYIA